MNPSKPKKKGLLPGGTKKGRIAIAIIGGAVLLTMILVIAGLFSQAVKGDTEALVSAAKHQQELIRVADIGVKKARIQEAKNIAVTTKLALQSQQTEMLAAVKTSGRKLSAAELASGKNAKTDQLLTTAEQNNRFDEVFLETMSTSLTEYQRVVKRAYDGAKSQKLQDTLSVQYENASMLAGAALKSDS